MVILLIMVIGAIVLLMGGRFYAPLIGRALGERADRTTPAVAINDNRDYVPTRTPVVFAHHYASIAGAGPIIGPVIAILYGWGPALLWILLGGVFLGAVHDYVATHIALREGGKNLTVTVRRYVGKTAFVMLLVMLVFVLALVCAAFLDLSARALTSRLPVAELQLDATQTLFRTQDGQAVIGGIASMSVIVITACSPLLGFLHLKRKWPVSICSLLALLICGVSILVGLRFPVTVTPTTWKLMISAYVLISAGLPVWLFLQSRDFINVHFLYVGIIFLFVALMAAAIRGGGHFALADAIPMNNWTEGVAKHGSGWPCMFVIIACGAVSGFHSLCAGGTTCKQLRSEPAARRVGYYGMLLESFLALCVVLSLVVGLSLATYKGYCYPKVGKNPILTFAMAVGHTGKIGLGLPVAAGALGAMLILEGFLVTTLDTAIRLTRYMIEEGWATFFGRYDVFAPSTGSTPDHPALSTHGIKRVGLRILRYYWINSGLAVALMLLLGWGQGYLVVWKIFGSTNQLLASLVLLVATTWLVKNSRPIWYTLLPALFMLATSVTMMVRLLIAFLGNWPNDLMLVFADIIVLALSLAIVLLALRQWISGASRTVAAAD